MALAIIRKALRYRIGAPRLALRPPADTIEECPYDHPVPGAWTQYGNLRDELGRYSNLRDANNTGRFRPYLPADDITGAYGEFTPDPRFSGFLRNVRLQVERARSLERERLELDNADSKGLSINAVLAAHDLAWTVGGLKTIAKNPLNVSDPQRYISHPSIDLVIMERDDQGRGSDAMEALRHAVGQPELAVRFVGYHDSGQNDERWCRAVADNIKHKGYRNMGVTFSPAGEYTTAIDFALPA